MLRYDTYIEKKRGIIMKFRDRVANFMQGRYGTDDFSKFLLVATMVLFVLSMFIRRSILYYLALVILIYSYFRMLSRNISKRAGENQRYLDLKDRVTGIFSKNKSYRQQAQDGFRFFKCPNCRQKVRVPKGKGKIRIHCPKCNTDFIKKS